MNRMFPSLQFLSTAVFTLALVFFTSPVSALTGSGDTRYRDNGDGTVTDLQTNLTWQRCVSNYRWNGDSCVLDSGRTEYSETLELAQSSRVAGYDDWRVPATNELRGLVYCSSGIPGFELSERDIECESVFTKPTADRTVFHFESSNHILWASEQDEIAGQAAVVDFASGKTRMLRDTNNYATRLVRSAEVTGNLLQLEVTGTGQGVVSTPAMECGDKCHLDMNDGERITLTAQPAPGTIFDGWSGTCSGTEPTCEVEASERVKVVAKFSLSMAENRYVLHNDGTAYDREAGLLWSRCAYGQQWVDGECDGYAEGGTYGQIESDITQLELAGHTDWRLPTQAELGNRVYCEIDERLGVAGTNSCDNDGRSRFRDPIVTPRSWSVWLWTANQGDLENSKIAFNGNGDWESRDSQEQAYAVVVKDVPKSQAYLRVSFAGSGSGAIHSTSFNTCESDCQRFTETGSTVSLTAQADPGSEFIGWSGACEGTGECRFNAESGKQVRANFMKAAVSRYVNNLDGTVSDSTTQLTWKVCPVGYSVKNSGEGHSCEYNGSAGDIERVLEQLNNGYSFAGYSDWRVASIAELNSIVMCQQGVWKGSDEDSCGYNSLEQTIHPELATSHTGSILLRHVASRELADEATETNRIYKGVDFTNGAEVLANKTSHKVFLVRDTSLQNASIGIQFNLAHSGSVIAQQNDTEQQCSDSCTLQLDDANDIRLMALSKPGYEFTGWQGSCEADGVVCHITAQQLQEEQRINVQPQYRVLMAAERYQWVNEQSIEDTETGLIWQRCAVGSVWREGQCQDSPEEMQVEAAASYAESAVFDGADNWRLPTLSELRSLVMCRDARSPRWPEHESLCQNSFESLQHIDVSAFGWLPGGERQYFGQLDDESGYRRFSFVSLSVQNTGYPAAVRMVRTRAERETKQQRLGINIEGAANAGSVSVQPQELECVESCELGFSNNEYIVLTAQANDGYEFKGWSGACSSTDATCLVRMSQKRSVYASFAPQQAEQRFVFNSDGTAFDRWSGLTWQRCAHGQAWDGSKCTGVAETVTFAEASALQGADWRLPTQDELAGLVYCASGRPAYWTDAEQQCAEDNDQPTVKDGVLFGMDDSFKARPWSSDISNDGSAAATIDFIHGVRFTQENSRASVWLVRGSALPLTVQTDGDGGVGVHVSPVNATCGGLCEYSLAQGTTATVTVAPESNTAFSHWSGACSGTSLSCQVEMTDAKNVVAHYDWKHLSVQATTTGNGTVSLSQSSVRYGDSVSFSVSPNMGYRIGNVQACGSLTRNGSQFTVSNVTKDCDIEVAFDPILYQVTTHTSNGVSVSPGSVELLLGQTQTFNITLEEGYELTSVTGCNGTLDGLSYTTAEINSDCEIIFDADKKQYSVVFDLGEAGTLTEGSLEQTVTHGEAATAPEFTLIRGWEFTGWSATFEAVTSDLSITAEYQEVPYVYYVDISAKGNGSLNPVGVHEVAEGQPLEIEASPAEGWDIAKYVNSTCPEGSWTGNTYTIDAIDVDCALEFSFTKPAAGGGSLLLIMAVEAQKKKAQTEESNN